MNIDGGAGISLNAEEPRVQLSCVSENLLF